MKSRDEFLSYSPARILISIQQKFNQSVDLDAAGISWSGVRGSPRDADPAGGSQDRE